MSQVIPTLSTKQTGPAGVGSAHRALIAALAHELDAAIAVWADLPLQTARTRKATRHIMALEARLASLQHKETCHV